MLRSLVAYALSWRMLVLALALVIAGLGSWAFVKLPVDAYPDIAPTQVKIILKAPGMTPEEVETRVITPIEMEMLGIPNQSILRATAKYAIADITIDFKDGTDIYWARQRSRNGSPVRWAASLPRSTAGWLRSRRLCRNFSCSPSTVRSASMKSAACLTGPSAPPCAPCRASPM